MKLLLILHFLYLECPENQWGENCANNCTCSEQGTDDCVSTRGCVCLTGYTGASCADDVDECTETPDICPTGTDCSNTDGSYECSCSLGFQKDSSGNCNGNF